MCSAKTPVERCFEIIELLTSETDGIRLGEISRRLDFPKSATHRMLSTLCANGWVQQDSNTGFYRLTLRLAVLGQHFLNATRIQDLCRPVLDRLANESCELVRLAVVDSDRLLWIDSVQGARSGLTYQPLHSEKVPLHATAAGQAWLATLSVEHAVRMVITDGFCESNGFGPKATRSIEGLLGALDATRKRGWAVSNEEAEAGVAGVAAAIGNGHSHKPSLGAVSIDVPLVRFPQVRRSRFGKLVVAAARELSELLPVRSASATPAPPSRQSVKSPDLRKVS